MSDLGHDQPGVAVGGRTAVAVAAVAVAAVDVKQLRLFYLVSRDVER
jgi:hypothetical protein